MQVVTVSNPLFGYYTFSTRTFLKKLKLQDTCPYKKINPKYINNSKEEGRGFYVRQ
jgi:hypothetical protein